LNFSILAGCLAAFAQFSTNWHQQHKTNQTGYNDEDQHIGVIAKILARYHHRC
jgi:hypothetical protein